LATRVRGRTGIAVAIRPDEKIGGQRDLLSGLRQAIADGVTRKAGIVFFA
jgi:hypothetical protein